MSVTLTRCCAAPQGASWLLAVPGASSTVLEVNVPYSRSSLVELLGQVRLGCCGDGAAAAPAHEPSWLLDSASVATHMQEPSQYCSPETALDLAKAAFQRAAALSSFGTSIIGLGATAALASEPPKRGDHRVYIAAHTCHGTHCQVGVHPGSVWSLPACCQAGCCTQCHHLPTPPPILRHRV